MTSARERREGPRPSRLRGFSGFLTRRPRLALASWVVLVVVLALVGKDLAGQLEAHPLYIDGTEATEAREISLQQFGSDESMVVALSGPRVAVDRQGEELARRLNDLPQTIVVSPWSAGTAIEGLRPKPGVAGVVVRVGHRSDEALEEMLELVEGQVETTVHPPVEASVAGLPKIFDAYADANETASRTGEMIAIPVLLVILLLVFRSVVAALIPVVVGGVVVAATEGVLRLLLPFVHIESFALSVAGMMGLALGVDYSLLVVSRFREEMRTHDDVAEAVRVTVTNTGRAIIPAGSGLIFATLAAALILPSALLTSSSCVVIAATVLSMVSALLLVPAALTLMGAHLDRWALPMRGDKRSAASSWSLALSRRPVVLIAVMGFLLFCAAWALTLKSDSGTTALLPEGDTGRQQQEEVERALGPGWAAPLEVIMVGRGEPITTAARLRSLAAFQRRMEADPGVSTMIGFR